MAVTITLDIVKTNPAAAQYDLALVISASSGIDMNLFVFDFPGLEFQQIATPFAIDNYPVYSTGSPPVVGTNYVRLGAATLSFSDPDDATDALVNVKAQLDQLAIDWDIKVSAFTGTEQYISNAP